MSEVWDLSRGFLPSDDPLRELPKGFAALDQFGAELSKLLAAGVVGKQIKNLPVPNHLILPEAALERAMMLYSFIGHALVFEKWKENKPRNIIPANVAIPWCAIAGALGRPPVLSYASYALNNWRKIEGAGHIALGNICLLQNFLGGLDEEWFILPHVAIEAEAAVPVACGKLIIGELRDKKSNADPSDISWCLKIMHIGLKDVNRVMERLPEGCDPYIYYNRVRPYIHGWRDNPALPQGVIYEGVRKFDEKPQQFRGETGAQSSIIPFIDAVFGVNHEDHLPDGSPDVLKSYLLDMRNYMPQEHREYLSEAGLASKENSLRDFIFKNSAHSGLAEAYNSCIEELVKFSETHINYALRYIHAQSQKGSNPKDVGTGGTPFIPYLNKHKKEREACFIK